ncbi:glycosyltransferase [Synechococcus sp. LA31]|uniref:glycosyltransferase n=1 Tax=Synechococcus sp. LA31 TaxID=2741953 RepID=UPI001BDC85AB|nr:glycosyltransferase [Synechococcus sp. LA31]QVV68737.1 glycosyltransferase [Synechococcus sp. LA31]
MKKILIVTSVSTTLALILKDQPSYLSNYFDVSTASGHDPLCDHLISDARTTHYFLPIRRKFSPLNDVFAILGMIILIKQLKINIIHSYTPKAGLISSIGGFLSKVPVRIHTFTGLHFPYTSSPVKYLYLIHDWLICRFATTVLAESKGVSRDLYSARLLNNPPRVLGNGSIVGVDCEHFSPYITTLRNDYQSSHDTPLKFIYCGRVHKDKGIHDLLRVFTSHLINSSLTIIGPNESDLDFTKEPFCSNQKITYLGMQQDVRPYLLDSDVFILPSYREGFPNVLLEASSMELPIVSSAVSGAEDLITNDYNGWLFSPRDIDKMFQLIQRIETIPRMRLKQMGKNARKRVLELYNQQSVRSHLISFYSLF